MMLNSKSILDCDEYEEEIHNEEIENLSKRISLLTDYDCAAVFRSIDPANKQKSDVIKGCKLHDFLDMIEFVDIKNGMDVFLLEDGSLLLRAYGQSYCLNSNNYLVTTDIYILPYDKMRNSVDLSMFDITSINDKYKVS